MSGFVPLTNGSGTTPDPAIFVSDLQDGKKKFKVFCILLFESTFPSFFKDKRSPKTVPRNQGFSYYFCLMIEESRVGTCSNESGSGRQKSYGSYGSGSGFVTLLTTYLFQWPQNRTEVPEEFRSGSSRSVISWPPRSGSVTRI